jgi:cytochrome c biogenesis factor
LTEVAIHRTLRADLYVVLASENENGSVTLRVLVNPLVVVAWFAFPLFTLGTAIAIFYKPRRLAEPVTDSQLGYV